MLRLRWLVYLVGGVVALLYSYFSGDQTVSVETFRVVWVVVAMVVYLSCLSLVTHLSFGLRATSVVAEVVLVGILSTFTGGLGSPFLFLLWFTVTLAALDHGAHLGLASALVACLSLAVLSKALQAPLPAEEMLGRWFSLLSLGCLGFFVSRAGVREDYRRFDNSERELEKFHKIARQQSESRRETEERLFQERRRFEGLVEVSSRLASLRSRKKLLQAITECALDQMGVRTAALLLVEDGKLKVVESLGVSHPARVRLETPLDSFLGRVLASGEAVCLDSRVDPGELEDLAPQEQFPEALARHQKGSGFTNRVDRFNDLLAVPMRGSLQKNSFGLLLVANLVARDHFSPNDLDYLRILATNAAIALHNLEAKARIEQTHFEMIRALAQAIEAKDLYTSNHVGRVRDLSVRIAEVLGLGADEIKEVGIAATLHDVGKISTPDVILSKPGGLTQEEYEVMKKHAENGAAIVKNIQSLPPSVYRMVLHHHERWDGKGYPAGLKGDQIPTGAQIIAVADCYDAMTYDRPYRKGFLKEEALYKMEQGAGTQFNATVLTAFFAMCGYQPRTNRQAVTYYDQVLPSLELNRPPVFDFATMAHVPEIELPGFAPKQVNEAPTKEKRKVLQIETMRPQVLQIDRNKESRA